MKHYGYCPYPDLKAEQPLDVASIKPEKPKPVRKEPQSIQTQRQRQKRRALLEELLADPAHPRHGTISAYQAGCRCEKCMSAYHSYRNKRKKGEKK